jgi:hypothetical protein
VYDAVANPGGWYVYAEPLPEALNTIIMHHSALPLGDGPLEIQAKHMQQRGFADIGYHFVIDEVGQIYEGRNLEARGAQPLTNLPSCHPTNFLLTSALVPVILEAGRYGNEMDSETHRFSVGLDLGTGPGVPCGLGPACRSRTSQRHTSAAGPGDGWASGSLFLLLS